MQSQFNTAFSQKWLNQQSQMFTDRDMASHVHLDSSEIEAFRNTNN
jgi:hypothetical protein